MSKATTTATPANSPQASPQQSAPNDPNAILQSVLRNMERGGTRLVRDVLVRLKPRIEDVLPPSLANQADRLIARATIYFNCNKTLTDCPPDAFVICVVQAAEVGLILDGKLCHCVRYGGKEERWQVIPDWKGLVAVARRSGAIADVKADIVRENDDFEYYHENGRDFIRHVIDHAEINEQRGRILGAYASVLLPDGRNVVEWMSLEQLTKVRNASKAKNDYSPWQMWPEEMMKKTAIRRGLKRYCDDPGIAGVLTLDMEGDDAAELPKAAPLPAGSLDLRRKPETNGAHPSTEPPTENQDADPLPSDGVLFSGGQDMPAAHAERR